jgi:hypothetical protein
MAVITERADKIVAELELTDAAQPRPDIGVPSAPSPPSQENSTADFPSLVVVR